MAKAYPKKWLNAVSEIRFVILANTGKNACSAYTLLLSTQSVAYRVEIG